MLGTADGLRVGILGGDVDAPVDDTNPNWTPGGPAGFRNALLTTERIITRAINYLDEEGGRTNTAVEAFRARLDEAVGENYPGGADEAAFQSIGSNLIQAVADLMGVGPSGVRYEHQQMSADDEWLVTHNLDFRYPSVQIVDDGGRTMLADVDYTDDDHLTITFANARAGSAIVRR